MATQNRLKIRYLAILAILGFGIGYLVSLFQSAPGYMDAEYYYLGGQNLVRGKGFWENILWNYLDNPAGLPHPSHAYWMPLTSIVSAIGGIISPKGEFSSARFVFLLIFSCIPPLTASLSFQFSQTIGAALLSGMLAIFPMFYLPFLTTTDSFGLCMILGALFIFSVQHFWLGQKPNPLLGGIFLGILAGLMHLTRADGVIWLAVAFGVIIWNGMQREGSLNRSFIFILKTILLCCGGYLLILAPWFARNLAVFGTLLSPGGSKALWITSYDELFSYPASILTPVNWLQSGFQSILKARFWASKLNLQTILAVQGGIFLFPLMLAGIWDFRKDLRVQTGLLAWVMTFLAMTLVFPYPGARGGFFHSGAAVQPLLWAMVPVGLEMFLAWGGRVRHWEIASARRFFQIGIVALAFIVTCVIVQTRVIGQYLSQPKWNQSASQYIGVERVIEAIGGKPNEIAMVVNPPGFYLASERPAIAIPNGDILTLLATARRYDARYLLLESDHPHGLDQLYASPKSLPGLDYLETYHSIHIFRFQDQ